ncbi:hypothetical protein VHUM_01616 [Vanrija humicola]|uniref:NAD-dependent epimerase/dehydratase domain-containing protein n=1 Tax=Vanrija humicola TaxID=5417 RepID=A0A7D8ZCQ5_VANHU|nr:hypothetical protein VHUM_01616 [Vanrija humicola]
MHILLTGATGTIGSLTAQRLSEHGHTVVATDVRPWSAAPKSPALPKNVSFVIADLTSIPAVDSLFKDQKFDGVIHLGAYPWPRADLDDRELYANNSVSSYLVMRTAVNNGVKRIVQASSVNAIGLSYSPEGHNLHKYDEFPLTEKSARRPEDAYALTKKECEIQADSLVLWAPGTRIASLRPHMVRDTYELAYPDCMARDHFAWVSNEACASACELGLTSEGWEGHEVFNIIAPEHCWEGTVEVQRKKGDDGPDVGVKGSSSRPTTLELLKHYWPHVKLDDAYFAQNPWRSVWSAEKAEKLLGWKHDEYPATKA